jgi:hypothetical protein
MAALAVLVAVVAALASGGGGRGQASGVASQLAHTATGSYHEPVTHATPPPTTTTAAPPPTATTPAPKKTKPPKGRKGAGPPGHDGKPAHGPKPPKPGD